MNAGTPLYNKLDASLNDNIGKKAVQCQAVKSQKETAKP
jgi:hypothetical protein